MAGVGVRSLKCGSNWKNYKKDTLDDMDFFFKGKQVVYVKKLVK